MKNLIALFAFSCQTPEISAGVFTKPTPPPDWIKGCEVAKEYRKPLRECQQNRTDYWQTREKLYDESRQVIHYAVLSCADGWISSCGCGGGRGCCSWHGGVGQCKRWTEEHFIINGERTSKNNAERHNQEEADKLSPLTCYDRKIELPWEVKTIVGKEDLRCNVFPSYKYEYYCTNEWRPAREGDYPWEPYYPGNPLGWKVPTVDKQLDNIHPLNSKKIEVRLSEDQPMTQDWANGWHSCLTAP